jgi:hypothetical protein
VQDRPTVDELLEAVAGFLTNDVMPNTSGRINFHARVSSNVLQMLRRELQHEEAHLDGEWSGLDGLLGPAPRPATLVETRTALDARNRDLATRIRAGDADAGPLRGALLAHLRRTTHDKLVVSNPALAEEGGPPA